MPERRALFKTDKALLCFTHSLKYVKTSLRAAKQTLPDPHTRNFSSANLTQSVVSEEEDCK